MRYSISPLALLLLSLFHLSAQALSIIPRQQNTALSCPAYSQTANYTFIGANSTIRAAFLQSSPAGTDPTRAILDTATKAFAATNMMFDKELNTRCGNLSTIAAREVGVNFTRGIVGPFVIKSAKGMGGRIGLEMAGWAVMGLGLGFGLLL